MAKPVRKNPSNTINKATSTRSKKTVHVRAKTTQKSRSNQSAKSVPTAAAGTSKQSAVLAMLQAPEGVTISTIMKATDWQQHSVRGFLAGTVRKKLGLELVSRKVDGKRLYRIEETARAS